MGDKISNNPEKTYTYGRRGYDGSVSYPTAFLVQEKEKASEKKSNDPDAKKAEETKPSKPPSPFLKKKSDSPKKKDAPAQPALSFDDKIKEGIPYALKFLGGVGTLFIVLFFYPYLCILGVVKFNDFYILGVACMFVFCVKDHIFLAMAEAIIAIYEARANYCDKRKEMQK